MTNRTCSVNQCAGTPHAQGLCPKHYMRLRRSGSLATRQPIDRFMALTDDSGDCWVWIGKQSKGYGVFYPTATRAVRAHRWSFEYHRGPIPDGLVIDHLCRNPACVRPAHLEAVTQRVNTLRGVGPAALHHRKTHCAHGHPFVAENVRLTKQGWRVCRACERGAGGSPSVHPVR